MRAPILLALACVLPAASTFAMIDLTRVEHVRPTLPKIPDTTFVLTAFGAVGDGTTMNTAAFARAIAAVRKAGGGHLVVPRGVYVTGPFRLCSNLDLHLEAEAVIKAPDTFAALGLPDPNSFRTQAEADAACRVPPPLISGYNLHDVALTGSGTIDGSGRHWWECSERAARNAAKAGHPGRIVYPRPHLIVISDSDRVHVSGLTLTNSSKFHLVPSRVDELTIDHVTVRAPWDGSAPNTDAIDPGPGQNIWIHHCDIDTGDDDIVIKSGGTNILIEDNTIRHGHGISIGSGTIAGVDGMLVRNCTFDGTDNGIRIKSMIGAGGLVQNVRYTGITMRNVDRAIIVQLDYADNNRPDFTGDRSKIPAVRNILFDHITVENARDSVIIHGIPQSRVTGIVMRDVTITAEKGFDLRFTDPPVLERVSCTVKPGVGPAVPSGEH